MRECGQNGYRAVVGADGGSMSRSGTPADSAGGGQPAVSQTGALPRVGLGAWRLVAELGALLAQVVAKLREERLHRVELCVAKQCALVAGSRGAPEERSRNAVSGRIAPSIETTQEGCDDRDRSSR